MRAPIKDDKFKEIVIKKKKWMNESYFCLKLKKEKD